MLIISQSFEIMVTDIFFIMGNCIDNWSLNFQSTVKYSSKFILITILFI